MCHRLNSAELSRNRVVQWFLITCPIGLPAVFCISLQPAVFFLSLVHNPSPIWKHHLFLRPSSRMFCPLPLHTYCIQQPPLSSSHSHLYAPGLRRSASPSTLLSVGLHSSLRWNCLPSLESSPRNTLVCDGSVCVCVVFSCLFFFNGTTILCSEIGSTMVVQEGHYSGCYFVDLWRSHSKCTVL